MNKFQILLNGIIKENPVLVMLLGICPSLAVTSMAHMGLGMGLSTMFVLICSNIVISLLKNVIPKEVRLPCYIVVISGFATFMQILLGAFLPELYSSLGLFLSLIAVNCIVFGRAEVFASKHSVLSSAIDGVGMGIGFTLALFIIGSVREIIGMGTWFEMPVIPEAIEPMAIFIMPAGGFFTLGILVAVVGKITNKPVRNISCDSCPSKAICKKAGISDREESKQEGLK